MMAKYSAYRRPDESAHVCVIAVNYGNREYPNIVIGIHENKAFEGNSHEIQCHFDISALIYVCAPTTRDSSRLVDVSADGIKVFQADFNQRFWKAFHIRSAPLV